MARTKVVVEDGGASLSFVEERSGACHAHKDAVFGSSRHIGAARSMNDALALIQRHAGRRIKSIGQPWRHCPVL